jgi:hypothetical protein
VWKRLDLQLLLYRSARVNDGAFPTKILESLHVGVTTLATAVPKTSSLEGVVAQSPFPEQLKRMVEVVGKPQESGRLKELYQYFKTEMDPRLHLARVAEFLTGA